MCTGALCPCSLWPSSIFHMFRSTVQSKSRDGPIMFSLSRNKFSQVIESTLSLCLCQHRQVCLLPPVTSVSRVGVHAALAIWHLCLADPFGVLQCAGKDTAWLGLGVLTNLRSPIGWHQEATDWCII
ncbi:hypothetical protein PVAP13_9KG047000 [Panicum virgatum]|uniref:Uncharacterized protein n=1 Tax=Panicum virgatum TaxID=38727 RepID=A0A8T0NIA6_PANVG|nr:hypothetical protein PVAP13_9KG047000 [Panicum virgatum]